MTIASSASDLADNAADAVDDGLDAARDAAKPARAKVADAAKAAGRVAKKVQSGFSDAVDEGASLSDAAKAKLKSIGDRAHEALEDVGDKAVSTRDDAYAAGAEIVKALYSVYTVANGYLRGGSRKRSSAIVIAVLAVGAYMLVRNRASLKERYDRLVQPSTF